MTMNKEELWEAVLAQIQFNISRASFATWFKDTRIASRNKNKVVIAVPSHFSLEWMQNKYDKIILKILHSLDTQIKEVKYITARPILQQGEEKEALPPIPESQLEFQELRVDTETNLNPRYTFENFVVGPFNELAQAAAWAVSKNPGMVYNPLFIYGGVGLGKTHLLQAIGNEIVSNFPDKQIKYISSEKFTSGLVKAIKNHNIEEFKTRYRQVDVLIVDDVQFLAGKDKTQEEFFHIFNTLYEKNRQITLTSDRPPKAIPALEERLKSRFEGGMIADINAPDFETRMAILKTKAQERKLSFSEKVFEYIASVIQNNIRQLEGALNRLAAYQKLNNQAPDIQTVKTIFKNLISSPVSVVNHKKIVQAVSEFYDIKQNELLSSSRKKEVVRPRQIAMYLLREELKYSYPSIGRRLGGKDHTTAIHAYEKIYKELKQSETLVEEINFIKQRIYGSLDSL